MKLSKSSSCKGSQNQRAADTLFGQLFENGMTSNVNDSSSKMETDDYCSKPLLENAQVAIFEDKNDETRDTKSHGSMESCRSANILSPRKRKCSFEQQLILGSKRFKKQNDQYATKTDYSFMDWISNILQGLKNRISNETRSLDSKKTGVQNVFQSLFSPETVARIEDRSISSSVLAKRRSKKSLGHVDTKNKKTASLVKQVSLYEKVSTEAPKGMFDAIRRLRLSRTDIHKWMNSQLPVAGLNGFFLRLRVAKREEGVEGSRYMLAA